MLPIGRKLELGDIVRLRAEHTHGGETVESVDTIIRILDHKYSRSLESLQYDVVGIEFHPSDYAFLAGDKLDVLDYVETDLSVQPPLNPLATAEPLDSQIAVTWDSNPEQTANVFAYIVEAQDQPLDPEAPNGGWVTVAVVPRIDPNAAGPPE